MTNWLVSVWFYICIINPLLQSNNLVLEGSLTIFMYSSLESRFNSGRREPKYGNIGAECKTYEWTWSIDCYWEGSIQVVGTKPVRVSICLSQFPDAVSCVWTRSTKRPAAYRLKHSIAPEQFKIGRCDHHRHSALINFHKTNINLAD